MKRFTSKTQRIGEFGELICQKYLLSKGYNILDRNYTKKTGEIDIIAVKSKKLHFVEVKSVSCEKNQRIDELYNPAENMTPEKINRIRAVVNCWLAENKSKYVSYETQLDLYLIYIDRMNIKHRVKKIENIF